MVYTITETPLGSALLARDDAGLRALRFSIGPSAAGPDAGWTRDDTAFDDAIEQLTAYFAGELREFDLPLCPEGTEFQQSVWAQLRRIPFGKTACYADVAVRLGKPTATRAVGAANGRNPLPIIIPCHRVIGANGDLTGFGGGLPMKRALLDHERTHDRECGVQMRLI